MNTSNGLENENTCAATYRVNVDQVSVLRAPATKSVTRDRFQFRNPIRKGLFFVTREGCLLTWRKYRAARLQRQINARRCLIFATMTASDDGWTTVFLGPQACRTLEQMVFPAAWVFEVRTAQIETLREDVQAWLLEVPERYQECINYSPYSGHRCSEELGLFLRSKGARVAEDVSPATPRLHQNTAIAKAANGSYALYLVGAGAYPVAYTLPVLRRARLASVVDLNEALAQRVALRFGFASYTTDWRTLLPQMINDANPVVILASYHSTHADIALALQSCVPGIRILIEKPPVTSRAQLAGLIRVYGETFMQVGYNRRYAPAMSFVQERLARISGPLTVTVSVKEIKLPTDHWYFWPTQGSRVLGNLCHWLDLGCWLIQAPVHQKTALSAHANGYDEVAINVTFADGSLLNILASDRGDDTRGVQEYIEIRRGNMTMVIEDFLRVCCYLENGRRVVKRWLRRDKGHLRMYADFECRLLNDQPFGYRVDDLRRVSELALDIVELLTSKRLHSVAETR